MLPRTFNIRCRFFELKTLSGIRWHKWFFHCGLLIKLNTSISGNGNAGKTDSSCVCLSSNFSNMHQWQRKPPKGGINLCHRVGKEFIPDPFRTEKKMSRNKKTPKNKKITSAENKIWRINKMKNEVLGAKLKEKSKNEGMTVEMLQDEEDDLMDLFEIMRENSATCGLGRSSGHQIDLEEKERAELCKECGACFEERIIRSRIDCRRKAAKNGMTLDTICSKCGKCECKKDYIQQ